VKRKTTSFSRLPADVKARTEQVTLRCPGGRISRRYLEGICQETLHKLRGTAASYPSRRAYLRKVSREMLGAVWTYACRTNSTGGSENGPSDILIPRTQVHRVIKALAWRLDSPEASDRNQLTDIIYGEIPASSVGDMKGSKETYFLISHKIKEPKTPVGAEDPLEDQEFSLDPSESTPVRIKAIKKKLDRREPDEMVRITMTVPARLIGSILAQIIESTGGNVQLES